MLPSTRGVGVETGVLLLDKQTVLWRYSRMDMSLTQPDSVTIQKLVGFVRSQ